MFREPPLRQIAYWLSFSNGLIIDTKHYVIVIAMFSSVSEMIIQQKTKPSKSRWCGPLLGNNSETWHSSFNKQKSCVVS